VPAKKKLAASTTASTLRMGTHAATLSTDPDLTIPIAATPSTHPISKKRGLKRMSSDASDGSGQAPVTVLSGQFAVTGRCLKKAVLVHVITCGASVKCSCPAAEQRHYAQISARSEWLNRMLSSLIRNDCSTKALSCFLTHVGNLIDLHRLECPVMKTDVVVDAVGCDLSDIVSPDADHFCVMDMDDAVGDSSGPASTKFKFPRKMAMEEIKLDVYGFDVSFLNRKKPICVYLDVENVTNLVKAVKFSMRSHHHIPDAPAVLASSSSVKSGVDDDVLQEEKPGCYYNYIGRYYQIKYFSRDTDKYCWSSRGLQVSSEGRHLDNKNNARLAAIKLWNELDQSLTPRIKF
jgi:hypothetical protein